MYRAWFIDPIGTLEALSWHLVFYAATMLAEKGSEPYRFMVVGFVPWRPAYVLLQSAIASLRGHR